MAKSIQCLPENVPNPAALSALGWKEVQSLIDIHRLLFIQKILSLDADCIYRLLFLRRFFFIVYSGVEGHCGPIAQIIFTCLKYNLLERVIQLIETGGLSSKSQWKRLIMNVVSDRDHSRWRFALSISSKLDLFRVVMWKCEPVCWWTLAKCLPYLKKPCVTMVRLMCGSCCLARYKCSEVPRDQRLCQWCDRNEVEDLLHFTLDCPRFSHTRRWLISSIIMGLSDPGRCVWDRLESRIKLYMLFGMDFPPLGCSDLAHIHIQSCVWIHKMYKERLELEG